jgi:hypothetical protein
VRTIKYPLVSLSPAKKKESKEERGKEKENIVHIVLDRPFLPGPENNPAQKEKIFVKKKKTQSCLLY